MKLDQKNNRQHTIVEKDFYRLKKSEDNVDKYIQHKKAKELGHCDPRPTWALKKSTYQMPVEVIVKELERS